MQILTQNFFARDTVTVAQELLGKHLVRVLPDGSRITVAITETEAYVGPIDKACHAYGYKLTPRTKTMFSAPGTAYIYLIYGMYHCLNLVTEPEGEPCAVLIRGAVPVENVDIIANNRFGCKYEDTTAYQRKNFLNGPGKLCKALALTRADDGESVLSPNGSLYLLDAPPVERFHTGPRIGIDYAEEAIHFPWRFWI